MSFLQFSLCHKFTKVTKLKVTSCDWPRIVYAEAIGFSFGQTLFKLKPTVDGQSSEV